MASYFHFLLLHPQGRKMMKAKRRNLTEDQKKNIFAGLVTSLYYPFKILLQFSSTLSTCKSLRFGGFTSSNKSAEEAFSFLGQPKTDEKKEKNVENLIRFLRKL